MGYPTAYRTAAARRLSRESGPSPSLPRPANDNIPKGPSWGDRPLPKPANDNIPANGPPLGPADVARLARMLKPLIRLHPVFRFLGLLDDLGLFNWIKEQTNPGDLRGWTQDCSQAAPCDDTACNTSFCINHGSYWGDGAACGPGHAFVPPADPTFHAGSRFRAFYVRRNPALEPCGGGAGFVTESWSHPFDGAQHPVYQPPIFPSTEFAPQIYPRFAPWRNPWVDPNILPIGQPVPEPLPPPYKAIPKRPDVDRGYDTPIDRLPDYTPHYDPGPMAWPDAAAGRKPPGPKEKEKKLKSGKTKALAALIIIARVHGKMADFRDLVEALNKSLPKELQAKCKGRCPIGTTLEAVWKNLDKMDSLEAIKNIIEEIAEDLIGGAGDKLRSEAAKKFGWFKNKIFTSPRF